MSEPITVHVKQETLEKLSKLANQHGMEIGEIACNILHLSLKKWGGRTPKEVRAELNEKLKNNSVWRENGCLEWVGSRNRYGYGQTNIGGFGISTHRASWALANGGLHVLRKGMEICHKCDNPPCMNPEHLYQGTKQENGRDRAVSRKGYFKLTEEQVRFIRSKKKWKRTGWVAYCAERFGVTDICVYQVLYKKTYKYIS